MKKLFICVISAFALNAIAADIPKKPVAKKQAAKVVKPAKPKLELGDKKPTPKKK